MNAALPPGSRIGVLGGGQLGRMLAGAAARLGFDVHIYTPEADSPASRVAARTTVAAWNDLAALEAFAEAVDVVTYEFENVPVETARFVAARKPMRPGVDSLEQTQDRLTEKRFIAACGLSPAPFAAVDSEADLDPAAIAVGLPAILKTRRLGYDGKGQARVRTDADLKTAWAAVGGAPSVLEGFVAFEREISVILARGAAGETVAFDPPENRHEGGVLAVSTVPAAITTTTAAAALDAAQALAAALGHVGVMAVEFFVAQDGSLIVNEIAPRVHNSGHWTADACDVCQFEMHVRAVCGWPLPAPRRRADVEMQNLLGGAAGDWAALAAETDLRLTLYGKREARPGRKMGHLSRLRPKS